MKLTFIGADHEVTGSAHYLQVGDKNIIVDYGMEQGVNLYVNQEPPFTPADTDYVFVTHAHIDHTGLLPLLYKQGFRGKILCTVATFELCSIMLKDCAHIQQFEAEWRSRKNKRSGKELVEPLYDFDDVDGVLVVPLGVLLHVPSGFCSYVYSVPTEPDTIFMLFITISFGYASLYCVKSSFALLPPPSFSA